MVLIAILSTIGILLVVTFIIFKLTNKSFEQQLKELNSKIVVITGGSLGIGRSLAFKCFENGATVIVLARNEQNLLNVKSELESKRVNESQVVLIKKTDVTCSSQVSKAFGEIIQEFERIDYLFNCAGKAVSNAFDDATIADFDLMMNLNYYGTLYPTKLAVEQMKKQKSGSIVIFSSIAGLVGLHGFSAYSSSKFALVGLAQCLHMELKSLNINVTCCFPPDTDTPGFEEEEKTKPEITKLICEAGGLEKPEAVANALLKDCFNKRFCSTIGFQNKLITIASSGMMPVTSYCQLVLEIISIGFCRLCISIFLIQCHQIINSKMAKGK